MPQQETDKNGTINTKSYHTTHEFAVEVRINGEIAERENQIPILRNNDNIAKIPKQLFTHHHTIR